jgi:hypothetical protein
LNFEEKKKLIFSNGIKGLYKGYFLTLSTFGPTSAIYLLVYEKLKTIYVSKRKKELNFIDYLMISTISNAIPTFFTSPLDLIKTRYQVQNFESKNQTNFLDFLYTIKKKENIFGFWKGSFARICYSAPNSGLVMTFYEVLKKYFN